VGSPLGLNLLRRAVSDPDAGVAIQAVMALERLGTPAARETLLAVLGDPRWAVVKIDAQALARLGEQRAAPRITTLLLETNVATHGLANARGRTQALGQALVDLGYTEPLDDLRRKVKTETDLECRTRLQDTVTRLGTVEAKGDDVAAWDRALDSSDDGIRHLAYHRLIEIGGPKAVKVLLDRFEGTRRSGKEEILEALGEIADPKAAPLLERVLMDDRFDFVEERTQRALAAWAAYRIGGDDMKALLRRSAERRHSQDFFVLLYYAGLVGEEALPMLTASREIRFRRPGRTLGFEQNALDSVAREIAAGRDPELTRLPPDTVHQQTKVLLEHAP
jgi:HEAT repeat protein